MKYSSLNLARISRGLVVAGLLAAGRAVAAGSSLSHEASSFLKEASEGNQGEIALAELAQQKSQNPEIKQLAELIQNDHQQSQEKLQTLARTHGVTLNQGLTWSQKRSQAKLEKLSGTDFDQQYAKDMLEDHVADLNKFQKASEKIQEADVKQFVQDNIPKLLAHLQKAESAAKAVGVDPSTISSITSKAPAKGGAGEQNEQQKGMGKQQQGY
jgi:putative membrane protein